MRRLFVSLLPVMLLAPTPALARQVTQISPLTLVAGQPVRITGMDVAFAPQIMEALAESDSKAARKRAEAGLPPLDGASYPTAGQSGDVYATLPFKQMFPLVVRDVARDWKLDHGTPVILRVTLDRLKTADAAMAIIVAWSSDMLEGTVDVVDAGSGASLGSFRVAVKNMHGGWGGMLIRGGGVREKLAEEFSLELARHIAGGKKPA